jgi:hypothetical protein
MDFKKILIILSALLFIQLSWISWRVYSSRGAMTEEEGGADLLYDLSEEEGEKEAAVAVAAEEDEGGNAKFWLILCKQILLLMGLMCAFCILPIIFQ